MEQINFQDLITPWEKEELVSGFNEEKYHATFALSSSRISRIVRDSVAHFKQSFFEQKKQTEAMRFGSLFHKAALEGPKFLKQYRVQPDFGDLRSKINRAAKDEWLADLPENAIIVNGQEELDQISGMLNSITAHPIAKYLLNGGERELSGFFNLDGFRCKLRADLFTSGNRLVDLKTTKRAKESEFIKSSWEDLYPVQAAFYIAGMRILRPDANVQNFDYIVVEKEAPYICEIYTASPEYITAGEAMFRVALESLKKAITQNNWLPRKQIARPLTIPPWGLRQVEDYQNAQD